MTFQKSVFLGGWIGYDGAMKAIPLLTLALFFAPEISRAEYFRLSCLDRGGEAIFSGLVELASPLPSGNFAREQSVSYVSLISSKPRLVVDRQSLKRYADVELKTCRGPYVSIFEKEEKNGTFRCAKGEASALGDLDDKGAEIIGALGLTGSAGRCAVVLPKSSLLDTFRRTSSVKRATKKK